MRGQSWCLVSFLQKKLAFWSLTWGKICFRYHWKYIIIYFSVYLPSNLQNTLTWFFSSLNGFFHHKTQNITKNEIFFYKECCDSCENALFPVKLGKRWALFKRKSFPDILPFLTTDVLKRAGMNKICWLTWIRSIKEGNCIMIHSSNYWCSILYH